MKMKPINTERLELIPMTVELCVADLTSHDLLCENLKATVPDTWPPALVTRETLEEFIAFLSSPDQNRFYAYYWIRTGLSPDKRVLIGSGGFVRGEDNILELGYSVIEEFQRQGYATEAVRSMITWAKTELHVTLIRACTFPDLIGSIKILEKNGFSLSGKGKEEGMIAYCLNI